MKIKALSFTQPWGTLVAIGAKRYETRSWQTSYRGLLAIHASKGFPRDAIECCFTQPFRSVLKGVIKTPADLPRGAVIAVATLVDCVPTWKLQKLISEQERDFGDFSYGRFAWEFTHVVVLPVPIEVRGNRLLWDVEIPDELLVKP